MNIILDKARERGIEPSGGGTLPASRPPQASSNPILQKRNERQERIEAGLPVGRKDRVEPTGMGEFVRRGTQFIPATGGPLYEKVKGMVGRDTGDDDVIESEYWGDTPNFMEQDLRDGLRTIGGGWIQAASVPVELAGLPKKAATKAFSRAGRAGLEGGMSGGLGEGLRELGAGLIMGEPADEIAKSTAEATALGAAGGFFGGSTLSLGATGAIKGAGMLANGPLGRSVSSAFGGIGKMINMATKIGQGVKVNSLKAWLKTQEYLRRMRAGSVSTPEAQKYVEMTDPEQIAADLLDGGIAGPKYATTPDDAAYIANKLKDATSTEEVTDILINGQAEYHLDNWASQIYDGVVADQSVSFASLRRGVQRLFGREGAEETGEKLTFEEQLQNIIEHEKAESGKSWVENMKEYFSGDSIRVEDMIRARLKMMTKDGLVPTLRTTPEHDYLDYTDTITSTNTRISEISKRIEEFLKGLGDTRRTHTFPDGTTVDSATFKGTTASPEEYGTFLRAFNDESIPVNEALVHLPNGSTESHLVNYIMNNALARGERKATVKNALKVFREWFADRRVTPSNLRKFMVEANKNARDIRQGKQDISQTGYVENHYSLLGRFAREELLDMLPSAVRNDVGDMLQQVSKLKSDIEVASVLNGRKVSTNAMVSFLGRYAALTIAAGASANIVTKGLSVAGAGSLVLAGFVARIGARILGRTFNKRMYSPEVRKALIQAVAALDDPKFVERMTKNMSKVERETFLKNLKEAETALPDLSPEQQAMRDSQETVRGFVEDTARAGQRQREGIQWADSEIQRAQDVPPALPEASPSSIRADYERRFMDEPYLPDEDLPTIR